MPSCQLAVSKQLTALATTSRLDSSVPHSLRDSRSVAYITETSKPQYERLQCVMSAYRRSLTESRFYVPPDTKQIISETSYGCSADISSNKYKELSTYYSIIFQQKFSKTGWAQGKPLVQYAVSQC